MIETVMKTRLLILGLIIGGILAGCNESGPEVKQDAGDSGGSLKALSPDGKEAPGGGVQKVTTE